MWPGHPCLLSLALGYGALRLQGSPTASGTRHVAVLARDQNHWATDVATPEGRKLVAAYADRITRLPDGVEIVVDPAEVELDPVSREWLDEEGTFTARKNVELLREFLAPLDANAVVIGSGYIGLEMAEALVQRDIAAFQSRHDAFQFGDGLRDPFGAGEPVDLAPLGERQGRPRVEEAVGVRGEAAAEPLAHRLHGEHHHLGVAGEIVPDRADGQARLGGHVAQRRLLQAVAVGHVEHGLDDRAPPFLWVDDFRHGSL